MKKMIGFGCAAMLAMSVMLTGCFGTDEEPMSSDTQVESDSENLTVPDTTEGNNVMSAEEEAYREWKDLEENEPAFDKNGASVKAGELLNRAVTIEHFIADYPESEYRDEAVEHYNRLVTAAITGGYVPESQTGHLYLDDEGLAIREDVYTEYNDFLNENGGTKTGSIVEEYVTLLDDEGRNFGDAVKTFYNDIVDRMQSMFDMMDGETDVNGGNNTNSNTNTNTNNTTNTNSNTNNTTR
ncbi:MAG: hypothetical protein IJ291_06030 [Lachnospiraceae bacterium]|nr:hypothetical protein [Lachnospiraceae bacterium]